MIELGQLFSLSGACFLLLIAPCFSRAPVIQVPRDHQPDTQKYRQLTKYLFSSTDEVTIPCKAGGKPKPKVSLEWKKPHGDWTKSHSATAKDSEFVVKEPGIYRCIAQNRFGKSVSYEYSVESAIQELGSVRSTTDIKESKNVQTGLRFVLPCGKLESQPMRIQISRFHNFSWVPVVKRGTVYSNQGFNADQKKVASVLQEWMYVDSTTGRMFFGVSTNKWRPGIQLSVGLVCVVNTAEGSNDPVTLAYLPPVYFIQFSSGTQMQNTGNGVVYTTPSPAKFPVPPYDVPAVSVMCVLRYMIHEWVVTLPSTSHAVSKSLSIYEKDGFTFRFGLYGHEKLMVGPAGNSGNRDPKYSGDYKCSTACREQGPGGKCTKTIEVLIKSFPTWKHKEGMQMAIAPVGADVKCEMEQSDQLTWEIDGKALTVRGQSINIKAGEKHGSVSCTGMNDMGKLKGWLSVVPQKISVKGSQSKFRKPRGGITSSVITQVVFDKHFTKRLEIEWQYITKDNVGERLGICNVTGDKLYEGKIRQRMIIKVGWEFSLCGGTVSMQKNLKDLVKCYRVVARSSDDVEFSVGSGDIGCPKKDKAQGASSKGMLIAIILGTISFILIAVIIIVIVMKRRRELKARDMDSEEAVAAIKEKSKQQKKSSPVEKIKKFFKDKFGKNEKEEGAEKRQGYLQLGKAGEEKAEKEGESKQGGPKGRDGEGKVAKGGKDAAKQGAGTKQMQMVGKKN